MQHIITEAGFLLSHAIDILNTQRSLHPFLTSIYSNGEQKVEHFKGLSYETSIPKAVESFYANEHNADATIAIYPAEIEEKGKRESVIIVMVKDHNKNRHLTIAQHYEQKDGVYIPTLYELIDFSLFLADELRELENSFLLGAQSFTSLYHAHQ